MAAINERVVQIRKSKQLTQKEFSEQINFSRSSLSEIESGTRCLNLGLIEAIKAAYPDINMDWLLTGEGEMLKNQPRAANDEMERFSEEDVRLLRMIKQLPPTQKNHEIKSIEVFLQSANEYARSLAQRGELRLAM